MELSRAEFERVVDEALATLPKRFADRIENVVIAVEDEPTEDDRAGFDDSDDEILGIYRGVGLTERSFGEAPYLPDEIAVFRGPTNRVARSRQEAIEEIRETIVHEIGHYFGLDEHELP